MCWRGDAVCWCGMLCAGVRVLCAGVRVLCADVEVLCAGVGFRVCVCWEGGLLAVMLLELVLCSAAC